MTKLYGLKSTIKNRVRIATSCIVHIISHLIVKPLNAIAPAIFDICHSRKIIIQIKHSKQRITFRDIGAKSRAYARAALLKEPSTILWIDSFEKNKNFLDVGASAGVFSLYAGITKDSQVTSIEPNNTLFRYLNLNIVDNHLDSNITAYPLAASSSEGFASLFMDEPFDDLGGSNFGKAVDARGKSYEPYFEQGIYSISLDSLLTKHDPFHYVKIDTDGNEMEILKGMTKILSSIHLKSILIELNENADDYKDIIRLIESYSLTFNPELTSKSYVSKKRGGRIYNHFFTKMINGDSSEI